MEKVGRDWVYEVLKAVSILLLLGNGFFFSVQVFVILGSDDPLLDHNSVTLLLVFGASLFCDWIGLWFFVFPSSRREYPLFKKFILIISTGSSSIFMVLGCRLWISSFVVQHP